MLTFGGNNNLLNQIRSPNKNHEPVSSKASDHVMSSQLQQHPKPYKEAERSTRTSVCSVNDKGMRLIFVHIIICSRCGNVEQDASLTIPHLDSSQNLLLNEKKLSILIPTSRDNN
ncbi:hypothetical protein AgCh_005063 [Apium graveolens]